MEGLIYYSIHLLHLLSLVPFEALTGDDTHYTLLFHREAMNKSVLNLTKLLYVSLLCLVLFPTTVFSQTAITELELRNQADFSFDVTITYDDNSTETIALNAEDETLVTAPSGKSMLTLTAGTKTVALPMTPSPQTGWNIPGTPLYKEFLGSFTDPNQGIFSFSLVPSP